MKKVLIVSPHADDEVLSSWTYLLYSRQKKIDLHIIYQAVNEDDRIKIIDSISKEFNFTYDIVWSGFDSLMDMIPSNEIISYYDNYLNDYDEIVIPSISFHQDHIIAHKSCIASLRRNNKSTILISEHPFNISYFVSNYKPNRYISFDNMLEKIDYLKIYYPYIKLSDIDSCYRLNMFRGNQIDEKYAESFQIIREVI